MTHYNFVSGEDPHYVYPGIQTHVDAEVWTLFYFTWIVELQHLLPLWLI